MSSFFWNTWRKRFFRSGSDVPKQSFGTRKCVRKRRTRRLELEQLEDRVVPSLTLNSHFTGMPEGIGGGGEPPDTQGAAGPSSVVETVNQGIAIYNKSTGAPIAPPDALADFYFTKGGLPHVPPVNTGDTDGQSDPFAIFDPQIQRFIIGDIDFEVDNNGNPVNNGGNQLLIAVSKSANPTTLDKTSWNFYTVDTAETGIALQDYPGNPGYNADALVVTLVSFDSNGAFVHTEVNAISMKSLTTAATGAAFTKGTDYFQTDIGEPLPRPAVMADAKSGDPMWMVSSSQGGMFSGQANTLDVVKMTNVLSASPTFTTTTLTVNPYHQSVNGLNPDGTTTDTLADSRILQSAEQNGLLVATHEISDAAGDEDSSRWYEINVSSGKPVVQQQGDVGGTPGVYDRYPGININSQGDIGLTFIRSAHAPGQFESMFITGRTPTDAPGTMEAPLLVQTGQANYVGSREGDMTRVDVDPSGTFWAFGQYATNAPSPNWGTAVGNFGLTLPIAITLTTATEGVPLNNVQVATFIDESGAPLSRYSASITWGDGTTSSGTVVAGGSPGTFRILGSHTYLEEGLYTLKVSESNGVSRLGPVSGIITVEDAPLQGFAQALNGQTAGFVSNSLVAVFTDTDPSPEPPSNYTATIIWNEGNGLSFTSTGTINPFSGNTFTVFGSTPFTFPSGGLFPVQVVIHDVGGASVTVNSVISVSNNPAIPPLVPQYQSDLGPVSLQFVSLQDALTNLLSAERLFLFALAFGSTHEKQGTFGNLLNAVRAYEAAIFAYDMALPGS